RHRQGRRSRRPCAAHPRQGRMAHDAQTKATCQCHPRAAATRLSGAQRSREHLAVSATDLSRQPCVRVLHRHPRRLPRRLAKTSRRNRAQKDFAVYALTGLEPKNGAEVLLCSQMVATWEAGLAMLSAAKSSTDFQSLEAQGSLAVKLLSVFERQFATLTKARKPPQVVTVEHVHRHLHVNAPGPTGEATIIEG